MKHKKIDKAGLTHLIFTGGSTRIPLIRQQIQSFLGIADENVCCAERPEEVIAYGAACGAAEFFYGRRSNQSIGVYQPDIDENAQSETEEEDDDSSELANSEVSGDLETEADHEIASSV